MSRLFRNFTPNSKGNLTKQTTTPKNDTETGTYKTASKRENSWPNNVSLRHHKEDVALLHVWTIAIYFLIYILY